MLDSAPRAGSGVRVRQRVRARTRLDFWLDAAILVGFTVAYSFGFTGPVVHEWWGLALGVVLLVHLTLHWDWVVRTTGRLFTRRGRDRLVWLVNLALLVSMTLCVASGVLVSVVALPALGVNMPGDGFWSGLHGTTAGIALALVPVHVALRWRWIVSVGRQVVARVPVRRSR